MTVAIISVGVNVVVSLATVERLGLQGLALGIAAGAWFEAITLAVLLHRRHQAIEARLIVSGGAISLLGAMASGLVAAVVLAITPDASGAGRLVGLTIELVLASTAALAVYVAYSRLVRLPELPRTIGLLRAALRPG